MMRTINGDKNTVIAKQTAIADTWPSRIKGLLGRESLKPGEALLITHCRSIHMFFMKFSIDAIFIDRQDRVVGVVKRIKPFQVSPVFFKAHAVIECPAGTVDDTRTAPGDKILFEKR